MTFQLSIYLPNQIKKEEVDKTFKSSREIVNP